jgi:hypothetical protein
MEIKLSGIVRWLVGLFFIVMAVGGIMQGEIFVFLFSLIIALLCIPAIADPLEKKANVSMSGSVRFVLVFVLVVGFFWAAASASHTTSVQNNQVAAPPANTLASSAVVPAATVAQEATPAETATAVETATDTVYKVGDRVVVGDMAYTVNSVKTEKTVGDQYLNGQADGIFVIVDMTIENLGQKSATIDSNYMKIIDSQSREFSSDSKNWIYLKDNVFLKQVQPGLPSKGEVIFDVPQGIACDLQVTDSIWGTNKALISLGTI